MTKRNDTTDTDLAQLVKLARLMGALLSDRTSRENAPTVPYHPIPGSALDIILNGKEI